MISYNTVISRLGQLLKLRQRIIASAIVYFKRFYFRYGYTCALSLFYSQKKSLISSSYRNSYIDFDPNVIAPTCAYLAAKVEECNTPAKVFDFGMRRLGAIMD